MAEGGDTKWHKALLKKLRAIETLKLRAARGEVLDSAQQAKVSTEGDLVSQLTAAGVGSSAVAEQRRAAATALREAVVVDSGHTTSKRGTRGAGDQDDSRATKRHCPETEAASNQGGTLAQPGQRHPSITSSSSRLGPTTSPRNRHPHNFFSSISQAETADAVFDVLDAAPNDVGRESASALAHAIHVLGRRPAPRTADRLVQVLQACGKSADGLDVRGFSKVYWAVAKLNRAAVSRQNTAVVHATRDLLQSVGKAAVRSLSTRFDARGVVTVLHTHATMEQRLTSVLGSAVLDRLAEVAADLSAQDVANCWWALAKLKLGREGHHLLPLRAQTARRTSTLKPHELSMTLWALASLNATLAPDLLSPMAEATQAVLPQCSPQAVANIAWAWARLDGLPPDTIQALFKTMVKTVTTFTPQGLSTSLWACARLGCPKKTILKALKRRGADVVSTMNTVELTHLVWALATVRLKRKEVLGAVAARVMQLSDACDWQLVGHIQHLDRATGGRALNKAAKAMIKSEARQGTAARATKEGAAAKASHHAGGGQAAAAPSPDMLPFGKWLRKLGRRTMIKATETCTVAHGPAMEAALKAAKPWKTDGFGGPAKKRRVLMVDLDCPSIEKKLTKKGYEVSVWSRTATQRHRGRPWPSRGGEVGSCLVRLSHFRAATEMLLTAVALQLEDGGGMWLVGTPAEGIHAAQQLLARLFSTVETVARGPTTTTAAGGGGAVEGDESDGDDVANGDGDASVGHDGMGDGGTGAANLSQSLVVLHAAGRKAPAPTTSLDAWRTQSTLTLEGADLPWVTYPGLFAGGELDVMTSALLAVVPPLAAGVRVLDHCCGSGTIAAALLVRHPGIRVDMLDNDAVAVKAARRNVPEAAAVHLLAGLEDLGKALDDDSEETTRHTTTTKGEGKGEGKGHKDSAKSTSTRLGKSKAAAGQAPSSQQLFDWIVSNPPVHVGLDPDFSVVTDMVRVGPSLLSPGGRMLFVTQTYVPVASLSTKACKLVEVWTDGRFTVWSHTRTA
eukprot:m.187159 g.187159  ORF g.187159 m.187159 type:complete len:1020 (+) comp16998_c0_seq1:156-3215(+)